MHLDGIECSQRPNGDALPSTWCLRWGKFHRNQCEIILNRGRKFLFGTVKGGLSLQHSASSHPLELSWEHVLSILLSVLLNHFLPDTINESIGGCTQLATNCRNQCQVWRETSVIKKHDSDTHDGIGSPGQCPNQQKPTHHFGQHYFHLKCIRWK